MRISQNFQNITASLLIAGFTVLPFLGFTPKASAQNYQSSGGNYQYQGDVDYQYQSRGVGYYVRLVGPMIPKLEGCVAMVKNGVSDIKRLFQTGMTESQYQTAQEEQHAYDTQKADEEHLLLSDAEEEAEEEVQSVEVNSKTSNKIESGTQKSTKEIEKTNKTLTARQVCLNSVGKLIAQVLIRELTASTIRWINTGNFGESFWPKDRSQFFKDIGKNTRLAFDQEIRNISPFSESFIRNNALAYQTKFAQNAQYSLNELIRDTTPQYTALMFQTNFANGGWNAWNYMTQVPANNPLGFYLLSQNELSRRLVGTVQSAAQDYRDTLREAGGFLGDQRCADPAGVTRQEHYAALVERSSSPTGPYQYDLCKKWEYVTPGKMVAEATTKLVNYPENQLLDVETLNDAIAAILDAALNKWGGDLINKGLAGMNQWGDGYQYNLSDGYAYNSGQGQSNIPYGYNYSGSWFEEHPDFDITEDLNQALIDEQRTYLDKLEEQNKALEELITWIYQLDYCIPGPNPEWKNKAGEKLDAIKRDFPDFVELVNESREKVDRSLIGIYSNFISIGMVSSLASTVINMLFGKGAPAAFHGEILSAIISNSNLKLQDVDNGKENKDNLSAQIQAIRILDILFERLSQAYEKTYLSSENTPADLYYLMNTLGRESAGKFSRLAGYQRMIEKNKDQIATITTVIEKLEELKANLEASSPDYAALTEQFAQLTKSFFSGDDIALADNLAKQIESEVDYLKFSVANCEKELAAVDSRYLSRPRYPLAVNHLYPISDGFLQNGEFIGFNAGYHPGQSGYAPSCSNPLESQHIDIDQMDDQGGIDHSDSLFDVYGGNRCSVNQLEKNLSIY